MTAFSRRPLRSDRDRLPSATSAPTRRCREREHRVRGSRLSFRQPKEIVMTIRNMLFATALVFASVGAAHADELRPIEAKSINLGDISGVAYYTIERDGFHVVTTLAQGEAGTPIRLGSLLAPGQSVGSLDAQWAVPSRNQPERRQRSRPRD